VPEVSRQLKQITDKAAMLEDKLRQAADREEQLQTQLSREIHQQRRLQEELHSYSFAIQLEKEMKEQDSKNFCLFYLTFGRNIYELKYI